MLKNANALIPQEYSPAGSATAFVEPSFPTIAGVNSNGAIVHYRAAEASCKTLTKNDMMLLDSGGQYLDGTTDVTRTFHMVCYRHATYVC